MWMYIHQQYEHENSHLWHLTRYAELLSVLDF